MVPVLAIILFSLTEFGFMLNDQISVVNAARNGARIAAIDGTSPSQATDVQAAVSQAANRLIGCTLANPTIASVPNSNGSGSSSQAAAWTVTASCTYSPITPLAPLFRLAGAGTTLNYSISQSSTMRDISCNRPTCNP